MSNLEFQSADTKEKDTLPEGWASSTLGAIAEAITYGYTSSAEVRSVGPRFLRITDIQNGHVNWNTVPTCKISASDIEKYGLHAGDVVFARTGATTGKSFLITSCPTAVFASYLIRLRLVLGLNPAFLALFFQTPEYWQFISENVAGNAQPNCNATKLASLTVPIPPIAEQDRLVQAATSLMSDVKCARERLAEVPAILKRFRQAVLAAACSGRLTEDWRENHRDCETGPKLLDRIRHEREASWISQKSAKAAHYPKPQLLDVLELPEIPESWLGQP